MRYLVIMYIKKPDGQVDEASTVVKSLKSKDLAMASVILDFKEKKSSAIGSELTSWMKEGTRIRTTEAMA